MSEEQHGELRLLDYFIGCQNDLYGKQKEQQIHLLSIEVWLLLSCQQKNSFYNTAIFPCVIKIKCIFNGQRRCILLNTSVVIYIFWCKRNKLEEYAVICNKRHRIGIRSLLRREISF